MKEKAGYEEVIFEIKKKMVYENDSESLYITVYATLDKREQVDKEMQDITVGDRNFFQYISFQNSDAQAKLGSLYINDINNIDIRYELITQSDMENRVQLESKLDSLRDTILTIKQGQHLLFIGLE